MKFKGSKYLSTFFCSINQFHNTILSRVTRTYRLYRLSGLSNYEIDSNTKKELINRFKVFLIGHTEYTR